MLTLLRQQGYDILIRGLQAFISRIEQVDGPYKSIVAVNPNAISAAEALDAERANGSVKGPLHGMPILVKNSIATSDLPNTGESPAPMPVVALIMSTMY